MCVTNSISYMYLHCNLYLKNIKIKKNREYCLELQYEKANKDSFNFNLDFPAFNHKYESLRLTYGIHNVKTDHGLTFGMPKKVFS